MLNNSGRDSTLLSEVLSEQLSQLTRPYKAKFTVIFKTLFVRFIRHSEGAVIVVVVARYISHVFM